MSWGIIISYIVLVVSLILVIVGASLDTSKSGVILMWVGLGLSLLSLISLFFYDIVFPKNKNPTSEIKTRVYDM